MSDAEVYNWERIKQPVLFEGLLYKNGSPTDVELALEFDGKLFIFVELKKRGEKLPSGQRLFFEHLANDHIHKCIVIVAEHDFPESEPLIAAEAMAVKYFFRDKWWPCEELNLNLKQMIDRILTKLGKEKYIGKAKCRT